MADIEDINREIDRGIAALEETPYTELQALAAERLAAYEHARQTIEDARLALVDAHEISVKVGALMLKYTQKTEEAQGIFSTVTAGSTRPQASTLNEAAATSVSESKDAQEIVAKVLNEEEDVSLQIETLQANMQRQLAHGPNAVDMYDTGAMLVERTITAANDFKTTS